MFATTSGTIRWGDLVIIYVDRSTLDCVLLQEGEAYNCKHGNYPHALIVGQPFGSQIVAKNKKGFVYALRPTPELWTLALPHRTQILYHPDIAFITSQLNIKPGSSVVEAGTGSGCFTHSLARTVGPSGKVYSREYHQERYEKATAEFASHGLTPVVSLEHRDAVKDGLGLDDEVDAVFLDLPTPELTIETAKRALRKDRLTRICCFSPCIEQVIKTVAELNKQGFIDVTMYETLIRNFDIVNAGLPSVSSAVERIAEVERKKGARREQQIAASAAKRAARDETAEYDAASTPKEEVGEKRPAPPEGNNVEPPAKRSKPEKTPNKNAAIQRAIKQGDALPGARPLPQIRGHTSYLTFATLLPSQTSAPRGLERQATGLIDIGTQETLVDGVSFGTPELSGSVAAANGSDAVQEQLPV